MCELEGDSVLLPYVFVGDFLIEVVDAGVEEWEDGVGSSSSDEVGELVGYSELFVCVCFETFLLDEVDATVEELMVLDVLVFICEVGEVTYHLVMTVDVDVALLR